METFWQAEQPAGGVINVLRQTWSGKQANAPAFSVNPSNILSDRLLTLWGDPTGGPGATYSIGIRNSEMAFFVTASSSSNFRFRRDNDDAILATIAGAGGIVLDESSQQPAGFANPGLLRWGGLGGNRAITSQATGAGKHLLGLQFYTAGALRMSILDNGRLHLSVVPTFASDAAAGAGGLTTGEVFKDSLGGLHIKL